MEEPNQLTIDCSIAALLSISILNGDVIGFSSRQCVRCGEYVNLPVLSNRWLGRIGEFHWVCPKCGGKWRAILFSNRPPPRAAVTIGPSVTRILEATRLVPLPA